jgi:hypothetical protein
MRFVGVAKSWFLRLFRKIAEFFSPVLHEGNAVFLGFWKSDFSFLRELRGFRGRIIAE